MTALRRTVYKHNGKVWEETYNSDDEETINKMFIGDLIAKYYWKSPQYGVTYRQYHYDGTSNITFYEKFGGVRIKKEYIVKED